MKLKIFTVYDTKAQFFGQPFFDQQEASAIRSWSDSVNDGSNPANQWHNHPEDFQLFLVGEFDNETGKVDSILPQALVMGSSLIRRDQLPVPKAAKDKKLAVN